MRYLSEPDFYPGQRVVCIDDTIKPELLYQTVNIFKNWVKKGESYIVREFLHNDDIAPGLLLEGVTNMPVLIPLLGRIQEPAFATWRFSPIQTVTDSLELIDELEIAHEIAL